MFSESKDLNSQELYRLLVDGVLPRPIAWVSTKDENGVTNLAPYSFFSVASCNPPVLSMTHINPADRMAKDTLLNLQITGECVVNIVSAELAEQMNASCANYAPEVSEFEALGIESVKSEMVSVVGVKASKVRYECTLRELISVGDQPMSGILILLDIKGVYVDDRVLNEQGIDSKLLDAIGKLGGNDYISTQSKFSLARPTT